MARAEAASASIRSDSIKGLAQSIANPAYRRLLTAEPALRRAVPALIIAFLLTICVGTVVQILDHRRQAIFDITRQIEAGADVLVERLDQNLIDESRTSIQGELDAYNPLLPDGGNWKATMLIEYPDAEERKRMLARMKGIERQVWVQVEGCERVNAIADEDLERENDEKTSAVHFLRFELDPGMIASLRAGAALAAGIEHEHYRHAVHEVPASTRLALMADFR